MGYWSKRFKDGFQMLALESIDHQLRAKIEGLAKEIGKFREAGDFSDSAYSKSGIAKYIRDTFGISVVLQNCTSLGIPEFYPFAAIQPPSLDKNHVLIPNYRRAIANSNDLVQHTKFTRNRGVMGTVDLANAKIGGAFSDVLCPLYVSSGMFGRNPKKPQADFEDIEIAAIIGHELGHVFSYFEKLTDTLVTNMIACAAANKLMGVSSDKERYEVLAEAEKQTGTKFKDKDVIVNASDKAQVHAHIVVEVEHFRQNDMGSEAYANRSWERLADDFSARLGCGQELASALVKVQKNDPMGWLVDRSIMPMGVHVAIETAWMVSVLLGGIASPIFAIGTVLTAYLASDPSTSLYDRPEERLEAIRQTMIDQLKHVTKGDAHKRILEDLDRIDAIMEMVEDKYTVMEMVHLYLTPGGRKDRKAISFHKELESYLFNELFVASATHKK
tara:strand:- start:495 stop:1826 length:1332 start_codon:yes stop_codon:yes gene_type:complete